MGRLPSESLHILAESDRTVIFAGVAGDLLIGETATVGLSPVVADQAEFYGGGVYQLTIDHRLPPNRIYLSLIMQQ